MIASTIKFDLPWTREEIERYEYNEHLEWREKTLKKRQVCYERFCKDFTNDMSYEEWQLYVGYELL